MNFHSAGALITISDYNNAYASLCAAVRVGTLI
jgi:hypothetical protein